MVEQRRDRGRDLGGQRHLDEDQRLVGELRMEEGEAAPVGRLQAVAQIVPVVDRVHRLVADDLLQDVGGRGPVDRPQHQEAAVEPGREQVREVVVDRLQVGARGQMGEKLLAHAHQGRGAAGREVEAPDQFLAARFGRLVQGLMVIGPGSPR